MPARSGRCSTPTRAASRAGQTAWFVVPSAADVEPFQRELAGLDGPPGRPLREPTPFGQVMVGASLERRLLARLGAGEALLSRDHRRAVALAAIRGTRLTALAPAARSGWLASQLVDLAEELASTRDLGGEAESTLERWSARTGDGRGDELAALLREDSRILDHVARQTPSRVDRATAADRVAAALRRDPSALAGLHLVLSGFDDLDPVQRSLVLATAQSDAEVVVSLPYQEGREALAAARGLVDVLTAAGTVVDPLTPEAGDGAVPAQLAQVERRIFEQVVFEAPLEAAPDEPSPFAVEPGERLGPLVDWDHAFVDAGEDEGREDSAPDVPETDAQEAGDPRSAPVLELRGGGPDEEAALIAEHVAARIVGGAAPRRIAVAVGEPARQGPKLRAALERAGIRAHLAASRPSSVWPTVGALLGLLRAVDDDGRPRDLVDWLTGPGAPGGRDAADGLDAMARRRGAVDAAEAHRMWKYLGHAQLEEFVELRDLRSRERRGQALPAAAFETAVAEILRARLAAATAAPGALGATQGRDLRAAAQILSVVDGLVELVAATAGGGAGPGLSLGLGELRELIAEVPSPANDQPDGTVAIVGPLDVRTRYLEVLVVARAQRGAYPASEPVRRILTPGDRKALGALGWPASARPDHALGERYLAYEVVARPTAQLVLSWHDGDGDGKPCEPSPLLAEVRRAAGGALPVLAMPSGSATRHAQQGDRLARITAARVGPRHREVAPEQSPLLAAQERDRYSVGALQTASRCAAQWFVDHHLRPQPLSPDAAPLTAGRIRHEVLAEVIGRVVTSRGIPLAPEALPALREELQAAAARRAPVDDGPPETLAERLMRDRVVAEIDATLPALCGEEQLAHQPAEFELAFGTTPRPVPGSDGSAGEMASGEAADDLRPPVTVERAGETLVLSGRIDRLDISWNDELVVVDYKGANVEPYKGAGWVENRELQAGLYALAAEQLAGSGSRAIASLYQPVPGPVGQSPRGAAAEPLEGRTPLSRNDRLDPETWDELLDALVHLAAEARRGIDDGIVAPDPSRCSAGGCRYPWLCREVQP